MKQLDEYNKYISALKGSEYDLLISVWNNLYKESQSLYNILKSSTPNNTDSLFVVDTFVEYRDKFSDECSYFQ